MRNLFSKLWKDDAGIVTLEYLILGTILALGLIVGVTAVTASLNSELTEFAQSLGGLNQSYASSGFSNCVSSKGGSGATDTNNTFGFTGKTAPDSATVQDNPCL